MVKLEYSLNEYAALNNINIGLLRGFDERLNKLPVMSMSTFRTLQVDKSIPLDLKNIDLINDLFKFNLDVDTSNQELHQLSVLYHEIRQGFVNRRYAGAGLQQILKGFKENLNAILRFFGIFRKKDKKSSGKGKDFTKQKIFVRLDNQNYLWETEISKEYGLTFEK